MSNLNEKLETIRHVVHQEPHIILDSAKCERCKKKPCLLFCPAQCFTLVDGAVQFQYAGCLECGTCRVVCPHEGALKWDYPLGGYGVSIRIG